MRRKGTANKRKNPYIWLLIKFSTLAPISILILIYFIQQKYSITVKNKIIFSNIFLDQVFHKGKIRYYSYNLDSHLTSFRYLGTTLIYSSKKFIWQIWHQTHICLAGPKLSSKHKQFIKWICRACLCPTAKDWKLMCCPQPTFIISNPQATVSISGMHSLHNFWRLILYPIHMKNWT